MTYEELEGMHDFQKFVEMCKMNVGDDVTALGDLYWLSWPLSHFWEHHFQEKCPVNQHVAAINIEIPQFWQPKFLISSRHSALFQQIQVLFPKFSNLCNR